MLDQISRASSSGPTCLTQQVDLFATCMSRQSVSQGGSQVLSVQPDFD